MNAPNLTLAQDDGYSVEPPQIEDVIQRLWREAVSDDGDTTLMQVRTLNLLVFVPEAYATPDTLRLIETASVQHPGRTITMLVSKDEQPAKAHVAIACRFNNGGKTVCGEQITVTSGDGGAPLPNLAASLLIAGLPVYMWWYGDPPFESALFASFAENTDRLIVDSRTWQTPLQTLKQLARVVAEHTPLVNYTDLQWTALTPWRRLTTQCFDMPNTLPHLWQLEHVAIEHGPSESDRVTALLYVSWLASRLGWQVRDQGTDRITFEAHEHTIEVRFQRRPHDSGLRSIALSSTTAQVRLTQPSQGACIKTEIMLSHAAPIERMSQPKVEQLAQQIGEELNMLERDRGFEAALAIAAQLVPPAA